MTEDEKNKLLEKNLNKQTLLQGTSLEIIDRELWPEPVSGHYLLAELVKVIRKYVVMLETQAIAIALWIIHTYVYYVFIITPILAITSPEKGCGKSTLLDVLFCLVQRPILVANASTASLFRSIDSDCPTLLIDEGDTFIGHNSELRGVINSGVRKGGAVVRIEGKDREPRTFKTFCPKAIASIKKPPDTIQDRSILIELKRRRPDEEVSRFSVNNTEELEVLARKAARWANDHRDALSCANPDIPDFLFNRSADNWRALLAIADEVDLNNWGIRARNTAKELTEANNGDASSVGTELLFDIWDVFNTRGVDRLPSKELIAELISIDDRPWAEFKGGKPLSPHQLANIMCSFGIAPSSIRIGVGRTPKGYKRDQFLDAWARYLYSYRCDQTETVVGSCVSENAKNTNNTNACGDVAASYDGCSQENDEIPF